ncbi:autotransporter assembly complex protein TamA [Pseudoduganella albidiflava]|uniref:Translocation and assembly module subunit TamA n=2 Tax=Pseudoduganella albidiflava TaxID=321983 RepID=A0A411X496_9BURK|nr:autotransporter assembly complex family protein [Pseudoduganella albidiflava]QBI03820.1 outer membrane protein assembly factor [Pseudoduganella albidiflava]GGY70469.1 outer membrane protein assembly factor [Pseudoduganella albidiflava]
MRLACVVVLAAPLALHAAEGLQYNVRINAPGDLDDLLEENLDLLKYRGNPRTDIEQLRRMVRTAPAQANTLLATEGYYSPTVNVRLDESGTSPQVTVDVTPGDPVLVGAVEIVLNGFASNPESPFDKEALKASWPLAEGQVFRQADWEGAKRAILRAVVQTRYPRAQMTESVATVDPDTKRALLRVALDSGPEMRFGAIRIEGLKRYPEEIILNLNKIKPGDLYSEAELQAFQSKLQDTGYFSYVEVTADLNTLIGERQEAQAEQSAGAPQPATLPPVPLLVHVVENKRKNASVGIGFSTNTGGRASVAYDDLAVWGLRLKSALTVEQKKQSARGDFYFPTTADGYNDSFGAALERNDIEGEVTRTASVYAKRAWGTPLLERSISAEYLNESRTIAGATSETSSTHAMSLPITYAVTWRKLDNLVFPTRGYVLNATAGGALLPILTDEKFIRVTARGITYRPIDPKNLLIFRGEIGALRSGSKEGVPATYLFRAGGDNSVRGYAYQELGVQEGDATVGGRYLATASAEYQYWFRPTWGAAVFYDAGNAADSLSEIHPKSGYGVGARYKSPVGPINVDVAFGHATRKARLHFSLGFTF